MSITYRPKSFYISSLVSRTFFFEDGLSESWKMNGREEIGVVSRAESQS